MNASASVTTDKELRNASGSDAAERGLLVEEREVADLISDRPRDRRRGLVPLRFGEVCDHMVEVGVLGTQILDQSC